MSTSVRQLHDIATSLAQDAMIAREKGNFSVAVSLYRDAFEKEKQAAFLIKKERASEPTRSILFRSAASLAFQAELYREASQMVGEGLSGFPTARVFKELNVINEKIKLAIFNLENEIVPSSEGFIFHLVGNAIDYGSIPYNSLLGRIDAVQKTLRKTVSRIYNQPFNSRMENLIPTFHTPKPGSFSIEVSMSVKKNENYDLARQPSVVIDEYLKCFEMLEHGKLKELEEHIGDEAHFKYFVSMSKLIAPDGDSVTGIDFISKRQLVNLSITANRIPSFLVLDDDESGELVFMEVVGILNFASKKKTKSIGIVDEKGDSYRITMPDEGIAEYVKNFFDERVKVTGMGKGFKITKFQDISRID